MTLSQTKQSILTRFHRAICPGAAVANQYTATCNRSRSWRSHCLEYVRDWRRLRASLIRQRRCNKGYYIICLTGTHSPRRQIVVVRKITDKEVVSVFRCRRELLSGVQIILVRKAKVINHLFKRCVKIHFGVGFRQTLLSHDDKYTCANES